MFIEVDKIFSADLRSLNHIQLLLISRSRQQMHLLRVCLIVLQQQVVQVLQFVHWRGRLRPVMARTPFHRVHLRCGGA